MNIKSTIASSVVLAFFLIGCSEEAPKELKRIEPQEVLKETPKSVVKEEPKEETFLDIMNDAKDVALKAGRVVSKEVEKGVQSSLDTAEEVTEVVSDKVEETTDVVVEKAQEVKEVISEEVEEAVTSIKRTVAPSPLKTGKSIYKSCAGCHGANAEKAALGKSQIIKGWDSAKVTDALNGYKDGTYGGAMKALMKGQSSKLSDEDIDQVSKFISNL